MAFENMRGKPERTILDRASEKWRVEGIPTHAVHSPDFPG